MKISLAKRIAACALGCVFAFTSVPFINSGNTVIEAEAADENLSVNYEVQVNQGDIAALFADLTKQDTGNTSEGEGGSTTTSTIVYDRNLEKCAIERAKDLALYYNDTSLRPDGKSGKLIGPDGNSGGTAEGVISSELVSKGKPTWTSKDIPSGTVCVGIGHVSFDGNEYYSMLTSKQQATDPGDPSDTQTSKVMVSRTITSDLVGSYYAIYDMRNGLGESGNAAFSNGTAKGPDSLNMTLNGSMSTPSVTYAMTSKTGGSASGDMFTLTGISSTPSASDTKGLTVNSSTVTAKKVGNYNINYTTTIAGDRMVFSIPVTVTAADISNGQIAIKNPSDKYYANGTAYEPDVNVTLNGTTLRKDTDYTLAYTNNNPAATITKPQTATVTATGTGDYSGKISTTFQIETNNGGNLKDATITVANADAIIYDGKEKKPTVTVALHGVAVPTSSYDVTYSNNIKAGKTAVVKVTAKAGTGTTPSKYSGTKTQNFEIKPADISAATFEFPDSDNKSNTSPQYAYTGADIKPQPTVKVGSDTLKSGTDFTYSYSNNRAIGTGATVTVTGKGNYDSTTSASTTFEITQGDITKATITPTPATFTYNGQRQYPAAVVVSVAGHQLQQGTDYTITAFPNSVDAGTYTFTVTGINNFRSNSTGTTSTGNTNNNSSNNSSSNSSNTSTTGTTAAPGTITGSYTISAKDAATMYKNGDLAVTGLSTLTYNGKTRKPAISVVDNQLGTTLSSDTDYTRTDSNNKTPGTASIALTFKGNYSGTVTVKYKIKPKKTSISKVSAGKKKATVRYKKVSGISGYQVKAGTNRAVTSGTKTKNTTKTSYTMKSLKKGRRYYFKVRTYYTTSSGSKVYSGWSGVKSVKVK